jgi:hypothetical protein
MRSLYRILPLFLLHSALVPIHLWAQSDSQTLRSPAASLVGVAEFDFGIPTGGGRNYPFSLGGNLIGGYQFNRLFTLGIGVGIQGYGPSEMTLLPMFVDARLHFPQKKWTPYLAIDLGYSLSLDPGERGGILINPMVGGRIPLTETFAFGFGLGMRIQQNQAFRDPVWLRYDSNYFTVKLGMVMKFPRLSRFVFKQTMHRMRDKTKRDK